MATKKGTTATQKAIKASMDRVNELRRKPKKGEKLKEAPSVKKPAAKKPTKKAVPSEKKLAAKKPAKKAVSAEKREPVYLEHTPPVRRTLRDNHTTYRSAKPAEIKAALQRAGLTPSIEPVQPKRLKTFTFKDGFKPSAQQTDLFRWVEDGKGNVFVRARAGTGKTTSIIRAVELMHGSIMCVAFGKKIEVELNNKLTQHGLRYKASSATVHALGNRTLKRIYNKSVISFDKNQYMLDAIKPIGSYEFPKHLKSTTVKLVGMAKQSGVCALWQLDDKLAWEDLIDHYNLYDTLENEIDMPKCIAFAKEGLQWALDMAPKLYDFNDMLWVPIVQDMRFDQYDWVWVDEAQDLSKLRQIVVSKLLHSKSRLGAVGDEKQAIFGFAGADTSSIENIVTDFKCTTLPLTVTYRCAKNIVKEAQKFVPDIQAHENNELGNLIEMSWSDFEKEMLLLTPDDAILCRNNRYLTSVAFKLLRKGIACHIEGKDIGAGLTTLTNKWKVRNCDELEDRLEAYYDRERDKYIAKNREDKVEELDDRIQTLKVLMEGCNTVKELRDKIETLFRDTDGSNRSTVILSSVHKAKGLEWERVFILGYHELMPSKYAILDWQKEQEDHLRYVAITRAKMELVYLPTPPKDPAQ